MEHVLVGPTEARALGGLGARLRAVREAAGMSGLQLARTLGPGWRQPKVSRIENGVQLPTEDEIYAWASAVGADPAPLLALRGKALAEYGAWRDRITGAGGPAAFQDELRALEASCTALLAEYQPALVPIVTFAIASPIAPASGFVLYDSDLAVVETLGGRLQITAPEMIARYGRWLELATASRDHGETGCRDVLACRSRANARRLIIQRLATWRRGRSGGSRLQRIVRHLPFLC